MTGPADRCSNCDREVVSRYRLLGGQVCNACYSRTRRHPAPCEQCGAVRVLAFLGDNGERICDDCAGAPGRFSCRSCGSQEQLTGSQCGDCRLNDRLTELLEDDTGNVNPALQPLQEYLLHVSDRRAAVRWLKCEPIRSTLAAMAAGEKPVTHATLNALPQRTRTRYFRRLLIAAGVLPDIDVLLNDFEVWAHRFVTSLPAAHTPTVTRFLRWHLLPAIRRKHQKIPMSNGALGTRRTQLREIAAFLTWLDNQGVPLADCDQSRIDRYITAGSSTRRSLGSFLRWAHRAGTSPLLGIPPHAGSERPRVIPENELWSWSEELKNHDRLPLHVRLIGLFTLAFAQSVETSVALRLSDVVDTGTRMTITFARTPVVLPGWLAELVRTHLDAIISAPRYHPITNQWLFPGVMAGQHLGAPAVHRILAETGIRARPARESRLHQLAGAMPVSIVADITGISAEAAYRHSLRAAGTWHEYPAL